MVRYDNINAPCYGVPTGHSFETLKYIFQTTDTEKQLQTS